MLGKHLLGLDCQGCVRHQTESLLGDEFASYTANAVSFVFDAHEGGLKILDELVDADGVIFATPIYYGQMSAQGKLIIDRFYSIGQNPDKSLSGKAALIFTENQPEGTYANYIEMTKFSPFTFMGYEVIGHVDAGSAGPAGIVAEEQEDKLKEAYELGLKF